MCVYMCVCVCACVCVSVCLSVWLSIGMCESILYLYACYMDMDVCLHTHVIVVRLN